MINMQNWMFLSSFCELRSYFIENFQFDNIINLGAKFFDGYSVGTIVKNVSFVVSNYKEINKTTIIDCDNNND